MVGKGERDSDHQIISTVGGKRRDVLYNQRQPSSAVTRIKSLDNAQILSQHLFGLRDESSTFDFTRVSAVSAH